MGTGEGWRTGCSNLGLQVSQAWRGKGAGRKFGGGSGGPCETAELCPASVGRYLGVLEASGPGVDDSCQP